MIKKVYRYIRQKMTKFFSFFKPRYLKPTLSTYLVANKIAPKGLIHVGANTAQEMEQYINLGNFPVVYIDPIDEMIQRISEKINRLKVNGHITLKACCSDHTGETISFNIASNNGESSSMLALGSHKSLHPEINYTESIETTTTTLDDLLNENIPGLQANILIIDTQGADLKVLIGAEETLKHIDAIYIEVSDFPIYENGATFDQIYQFLKERDFFCHAVSIKHIGYGDAFFVHKRKLNVHFG